MKNVQECLKYFMLKQNHVIHYYIEIRESIFKFSFYLLLFLGKRKKRKTVDNHSMYLNEKSLKIYTDSISEAKTKMEVALGVYGHTFLEQSSSIREVMPQESNKPAEHQGVEDASLMILDNNDQLEDFDSSRFRNSEQHKETETVPEEPIEIAEHPEQDNKSEEKKKYLSPRKAKERACLEISSTGKNIFIYLTNK